MSMSIYQCVCVLRYERERQREREREKEKVIFRKSERMEEELK